MDLCRVLEAIEVLVSSTDSSEDEEVLFSLRKESILKITNFVACVHSYDSELFRQHFRLTRDSFFRVVTLFENSQFMPRNIAGREHLSAETHVLMFLYFAGTKQVCRTVAQQFGVSLATFHRGVTKILRFFFRIAPRFIFMPQTIEDKARIASEFQKLANFPNVIGCIDGSYIPITTPARKLRMTYVNSHHQTALTLQGICDSQGKFLDAVTGFSSKIHDSRVYMLSFVYKEIVSICSPNNTYHLIGDSAYPLRPTLLTPYRYIESTENVKRKYNKAHCKTRVKIENAFGLLKGRFRQLLRLDFHKVERASYFIIACCVLHNMCIDWKEPEFEKHIEIHPEEPSEETSQERRMGEIKRNYIAELI